MSTRPRPTPKLTTVRAGIGTHRLSAGLCAGSPVGKLTNDQLDDATAQLEHEAQRMKGLDDDAAVKRLKKDLKAVEAELDRRACCIGA